MLFTVASEVDTVPCVLSICHLTTSSTFFMTQKMLEVSLLWLMSLNCMVIINTSAYLLTGLWHSITRLSLAHFSPRGIQQESIESWQHRSG